MEQLEEYEYTIEHRPGTQHGNADAMSRRPIAEDGSDMMKDEENDIGATEPGMDATKTNDIISDDESMNESADKTPVGKIHVIRTDDTAQEAEEENSPEGIVLDWSSTKDLQDDQKSDPELSGIYRLKSSGDAKPSVE